ncbi:MAG: hypothetical protein AMJ53_02875 [Gammaproteobacteria bacterium SG8_11]|nr:MAG: hypothetical protein AMJ53_02875 [Gammaproteobacteria bacterium SG8_11]
MNEINTADRDRCIRLAYRSQDHDTQARIDYASWQLSAGIADRDKRRKAMFGPVSAMELVWALARHVYLRDD